MKATDGLSLQPNIPVNTVVQVDLLRARCSDTMPPPPEFPEMLKLAPWRGVAVFQKKLNSAPRNNGHSPALEGCDSRLRSNLLQLAHRRLIPESVLLTVF